MNQEDVPSDVANDDLIFAPDEKETANGNAFWKILIVDDEKEIHAVTELALRNFSFEARTLQFLHAYSGVEAARIMADHPDIAVVFLDVVMESDDAGLAVAKAIRTELGNKLVRIILRTGQAGLAPEREVIVDYEINDYKTKTELTAQKLFTTFVASLRNYRDLVAIESNRRGLEKIVSSSGSLFEMPSMEEFIEGVLTQVTALLYLQQDAVFCSTALFAAADSFGALAVLSGTGNYSQYRNRAAQEVLPKRVCADLKEAVRLKSSLYYDDRCVIYFYNKNGNSNMVYLEGIDAKNKVDKRLLDVFCANTSIAIDNLLLKQEIEDTQKEVVFRMGAIGETRSKETGNHVRRVAEYSRLLALKYGLSSAEADLLKQASPMHDIGKVGIPDSILNKTDKLTDQEWITIKSHSWLGHQMLRGSQRPILKTAATVALEHHEKWDGSGYPNGLASNDIHIFGRITAMADVFDALGSDRCYKKGWPLAEILALLEQERGRHFEPKLVDLFLDNLAEFQAIRDAMRDL